MAHTELRTAEGGITPAEVELHQGIPPELHDVVHRGYEEDTFFKLIIMLSILGIGFILSLSARFGYHLLLGTWREVTGVLIFLH